MKSPALGDGNTYYIISSGATNSDVGKVRVFNKIR